MPDIFVAPKIEEPARIATQSVAGGEEITKTEQVEPIASLAPEPRGHSLSSFLYYPENVRFDTQEEQENIILLLRKHWVTNVPWLILSVLLFSGPTLIFPFFFRIGLFSFLPGNFLVIFGLGWYLFSFGFTLINFITWYFNVYIVTDKRVIDVDFYQLLYKQMASTRISRVQDITYKLGGMVRSIFDYGDVFVQTAGTEENFDFAAVPHPQQVVQVIEELTEKGEQPL